MPTGRHHAALWLCVDNSSSALSETPEETHARKSFKCHAPGISLRERHLRTCQSFAPAPFAAVAICDQRSGENMSGLGEKSSIAETRDNVSPLSRPSFPLRENLALPHLGMTQPPSARLYKQGLARRMKDAREKRGFSQSEMAKALGIKVDRYKKMEQRGSLPPYLIEAFAVFVRRRVLFILTDRDEIEFDEPITRAPQRARRKA